jgi:hypothetical protein
MPPYTYSLATPSHWSLKCLALSSLARWAMRRCQPWAPCHAHRVHPCRSKRFQFCWCAVSIVTHAHSRKPNSPTNFAHVKVLVACPPSPAGRIAPNALPSIFCRGCSSHAARYAVFLFGIQRVELCVVSPAVLRAARSIQVSVRAKNQYQC